MTKMYIAYDGRAMYDTNPASILEAIGEDFTKADFDTWYGHDAVLVEYDVEDGDTLTNENLIGHWCIGFDSLRRIIINLGRK
jgi:hypothetical protein